jgi:hypothetical protein
MLGISLLAQIAENPGSVPLAVRVKCLETISAAQFASTEAQQRLGMSWSLPGSCFGEARSPWSAIIESLAVSTAMEVCLLRKIASAIVFRGFMPFKR